MLWQRIHRRLRSLGIRVHLIAPPSFDFDQETLTLEDAHRLLIVAPHPDDEWVGSGGLADVVSRRGGTVHIVVMTDGAGFVALKRQWEGRFATPFARARALESLRFLKELGQPPSSVDFLNFPDGHLRDLITPAGRDGEYPISLPAFDAIQRISRALSETEAETVLFPDYRDWHRDHWATHIFTAAALLTRATAPRALTYLVHYGNWPEPMGLHTDLPLLPPPALSRQHWWVLPLDSVTRAQKLTLGRNYLTQMLNRGEAFYLESFVRQNELFAEWQRQWHHPRLRVASNLVIFSPDSPALLLSGLYWWDRETPPHQIVARRNPGFPWEIPLAHANPSALLLWSLHPETGRVVDVAWYRSEFRGSLVPPRTGSQ